MLSTVLTTEKVEHTMHTSSTGTAHKCSKIERTDSGHLHWDELEDWRKDNAYIVTGYAHSSGSWSKSWAGLLGCPHNETVNVLTHLFGAIIVLSIFTYSYRHIHIDWFGTHPALASPTPKLFLVYPLPGNATSVTWADSIAFASFYISAAICFGCSATFHVSLNHSEVTFNRTARPEITLTSRPQTVFRAFLRLDYVGIVFLICGTAYPSLYYAFYCQPTQQAIYMAGTTAFGASESAGQTRLIGSKFALQPLHSSFPSSSGPRSVRPNPESSPCRFPAL